MKFRYERDRLFLIACFLYLLNRFGIKPYFHHTFFRNYFNDLLLIPCALPLILRLQRRLRLRLNDEPPTLTEIGFHLLVWSFLFEWISPHLIKATGDPWDVLAYTFGGLIAWIIWRN